MFSHCMWETLKTSWKIMEQHFQDVAQKVQYDKNSDTFAAHFTHHFDQNQLHNSAVK